MKTIFLGVCVALALAACEKGPAEKAGAAVDRAVDNVRDAVKKK